MVEKWSRQNKYIGKLKRFHETETESYPLAMD